MERSNPLLTLWFAIALFAGLTLLHTTPVAARSGGITGYSGNPATNGGAICSACHGGGIAPSVTLSGPTTVLPGSSSSYVLTLSGGQQNQGGVDVSASGGTLVDTNPTGTTISNGELIHVVPFAVDNNGAISWTFDWQAPTAPGTYTLYGAAASTNGSGTGGDEAAAATLVVTVSAVNQPPTADAGGPYSGTAGVAVQFDGSGSSDPDGTIASYAWEFGDGNTGTGVNPSHTYAAAGSYTVTLTVTDDVGASASATTTAQIAPAGQPQPPVADAGGTYTGTVNVAVQFDGSGSSDPDGMIMSYAWDFGDGGTGAGINPMHTYTAAGSYTVVLTVTDNDNLTGTASAAVTISAGNQPPTANAGGPYSGTAGVAVQFDGSGSSDPDGTIASYAWDFGDGNTGMGERPTHTYAVAGSYTVTLTVTDNDALVAMDQTAASIVPPAPNDGAQLYRDFCAGCHGDDGSGGTSDESVIGASASEIMEAIDEEEEMRFLQGLLNETQIKAIADFLGGDEDDDDDGHDDEDDHDDDEEDDEEHEEDEDHDDEEDDV